MGPKGISKKLLSYAFSEVASNIHWSGENYYLSEVINLSNIRLSRFNCTSNMILFFSINICIEI